MSGRQVDNSPPPSSSSNTLSKNIYKPGNAPKAQGHKLLVSSQHNFFPLPSSLHTGHSEIFPKTSLKKGTTKISHSSFSLHHSVLDVKRISYLFPTLSSHHKKIRSSIIVLFACKKKTVTLPHFNILSTQNCF